MGWESMNVTNNDSKGNPLGTFLIITLIFVLSYLAGYTTGVVTTKQTFWQEATKRGLAEPVVKTQETGQYKWKDKPNE